MGTRKYISGTHNRVAEQIGKIILMPNDKSVVGSVGFQDIGQ